MNIHKKEAAYKKARALQFEFNELHRKKWAMPSIPLDKPIAHGFVRSFEFFDEVKRRRDFDKIKEAFELCGQTKVYSKNKSFVENRKKTTVERHAYLRTIIDPRFRFFVTEEKRLLACEQIENVKKYLSFCGDYMCSCEDHRQMIGTNKFQYHYRFAKPWMLQEVTKPYFLTHYREVDTELESRLAYITRTMENNHYWELLYGNRRDYDDKDVWLNKKYEDTRILFGEDDLIDGF